MSFKVCLFIVTRLNPEPLARSNRMNNTKNSLNLHWAGCGPFTPKECCTLATQVKEVDRAAFEHLSMHFAAKAERMVRRAAFQKPVERVVKKVKRKKAKKERGLRINSSIDRLALSANVVDFLHKKKIDTVGKLVAMSPEKLTKAGAASTFADEIGSALKKFGKQLAD